MYYRYKNDFKNKVYANNLQGFSAFNDFIISFSFLAENIKRLKDESRAKERKIANLQKSIRCNRSYY